MKSSPLSKHFSRACVLIGLIVSAASCNQESDPSSLIAKTQFETSTLTVVENEGEQVIALSFDKPVPNDGELIITANSIAPLCYSTSPITELGKLKINASKGSMRTSFKMTPTDNSNLDGSKVVKFTISQVSQGIVTGINSELVVFVTDDESEVESGFESSDIRIRENNTAATRIEILFSQPAAADGVLVIDLASKAIYGVEYTTQPQAAAGKIFLQVSKGASSASINLFAINDNAFKADRNINFIISDATGGVAIGKNDSFICTITDDDGVQLTDIVSIRSMFVGNGLVIKKDTYIEGVVTSVNNTLASRVVIQDATGALPLQLLTDEMPKKGDVILVNLFNASVRELQGTLEAGVISSYEKLGEDIPQVTKMSLADLLNLGRQIESATIQLTNVTFPQANGTTRLRGDRMLTDGEKTIIVRTGTGVSFGDDLIPTGNVTVTGIFTKSDGLFVLYPQEAKDIKKQGVTPIRGGLVNIPH